MDMKDFKDYIIEELDVSVRLYNIMKRAGYHTDGQIVDC